MESHQIRGRLNLSLGYPSQGPNKIMLGMGLGFGAILLDADRVQSGAGTLWVVTIYLGVSTQIDEAPET